MSNCENDAGVGYVEVSASVSYDRGSHGYSSWISSNVPLLPLPSLLLMMTEKAAKVVAEGVTMVPQAEQALQGSMLVLT